MNNIPETPKNCTHGYHLGLLTDHDRITMLTRLFVFGQRLTLGTGNKLHVEVINQAGVPWLFFGLSGHDASARLNRITGWLDGYLTSLDIVAEPPMKKSTRRLHFSLQPEHDNTHL